MPEFSSLEIPKRHPAFRYSDDPPSVAEVIGSGLCVSFAYEALWPKASREKTAKFRNSAIEALCYELGSPWNSIGSSTPVRAGTTRNQIRVALGPCPSWTGKRPLDVDFAGALCKLCRTQIIPLAKRLHNSGVETEELHNEIRKVVSSSLLSFL